jgi:hypothetical protein
VPDEINGLPTHVLLIHAVVVLLPLCALLLVAAALWPPVRVRLGLALPVLALTCLVLVPLTTSAGEDLQSRIGGGGPLVERHAELGDGILIWAIGLAVLSCAVWWLGHRELPAGTARRPEHVGAGAGGAVESAVALRIALVILCAAVATGTVIQVVRTGESGARAVWQDAGQN